MSIRKRIASGRESFGTRVRRLRTERELTQSALGKAIGVSATCVWNWEEDNTHPRPASLRELAAALGTTTDFLQTGVTDQAQPSDEAADSSSLGSTIQAAREAIASAAGLQIAQVRVVLEYGD